MDKKETRMSPSLLKANWGVLPAITNEWRDKALVQDCLLWVLTVIKQIKFTFVYTSQLVCQTDAKVFYLFIENVKEFIGHTDQAWLKLDKCLMFYSNVKIRASNPVGLVINSCGCSDKANLWSRELLDWAISQDCPQFWKHSERCKVDFVWL